MKVEVEQTKWIEIPCLIPEHSRYSSGRDGGKWKYNICQRICHLGKNLVCAKCESDIFVNDQFEQECPKCGVVNFKENNHEPN